MEISDLNNIYIKNKNLNIIKLDDDIKWLDAGTTKRILNISNYIHYLESKQNTFYACLENIALRKGYISESKYYEQIDINKGSEYGELMKILIS